MQDRRHNRPAARRTIAGQYRGLDDDDLRQSQAQSGDRCSRDCRNAGDAGQRKSPGGDGRVVELRYSGCERAVIGEIDVINAGLDAEPRHAIGGISIGLERSGRIDDQVRSGHGDRREIAVQVQGKRLPAILTRKGGCPPAIAASDDDVMPGLDEQARQPAAKCAVAAKDDDLHESRRRFKPASGTAHISVRPKSR